MAQKFLALVSDSGTAFVIVTHVYAGIGTYSSPAVISGGKSIQYWSALTLSFSKGSVVKGDPVTADEGMHINVTVKKNHCLLDRNPYVKFDYFVKFGEGTEQIMSNLASFIALGFVEMPNNRTYIVKYPKNKETVKLTNKSQYIEYMTTHPEVLQDMIKMAGEQVSTVRNMDNEEIDEAKQEEDEIAKDLNLSNEE